MTIVHGKSFRHAAALCCALALLLGALSGCGGQESEPEPIPAASNEERVTYLGGLGWQVDPEPLETLAFQLPRELDGAYADYARLQEEQGLPFAQYAGRNASRYTYTVKNYPGYDGPVQINLWVCQGVLIGGDLIAPGENGVQAGLVFPKEAKKQGLPPVRKTLSFLSQITPRCR